MPRFNLSRGAWLVLATMFGLAPGVRAADDPAKALIDKLVEVDRQDTGYSGSDSGSAFLPLGQNEWQGGLLSPRQGKFGSSDAMKSLVKMGVKAVPALLDHLSDDRKTKIVLTHPGGFGGMFVTQDDEEKKKDDAVEKGGKEDDLFRESRYTVRVGDLCYVALGQIVNRPYTAVRYQPTAIISITCVPKCKQLRADLVKAWGKLTAEGHQKSLAKDLASSRIGTGAAIRLGYYYPEEFEPLVLKQLTRPTYDYRAVEDFILKQLYPAKTANERKELVEAFVKKHGDVARDAIRWNLFHDLPELGDDYLHLSDGSEAKARECLVQAFGYPDRVTRKDRPDEEPVAEGAQADLVSALVYDRSVKIDKFARDLLAKEEDNHTGLKLLDRLVGRGYDADIEAFLKRQGDKLNADDLKKYEARLGWTRLHAAVELDVPDLIEAALKGKIDVNAKGKDGRTALHLAAAGGKLAALEQLLAAKADPNVKDAEGKLPVQLAAFAEHPEVVRRLVAAKSAVPDALTAATIGDADQLASLLKSDPAGVKARTDDGYTPLHIAVHRGYEKATAVLLAGGADVNAVDARGSDPERSAKHTPLHLAVMAGKAGVAKLLLEKGAAVNAASKYGKYTPLHYAAGMGSVELVKLLLDHKANREAKDEDGRTPLDLAKAGKHTEVVRLLEAK
jgi:ankyrin repeat protein